jgi:hypothetical protein
MASRAAFVVAAGLIWFLSGAAVAQERPADTMEVLREKVRADKKVVVMAALELTESEAKGFWPVYNAYQSDMILHYDRVAKLLGDYTAAYESMTDETASRLLTEFLKLQTDHAAVLNRFRPRFDRVLPPRKVARLYQVENKIRAVLEYQLARDIPVVK